MATSRGNELVQGIRQQVEEMKQLCAGLDEETASRAPAGRWSPKEILSHVCGPEGGGHLPILQAFLQEENATIDLVTEDPFFTEKRAQTSFRQLLSEFEAEYERVCRFTLELDDEQLAHRATVPKLKDSPLGERPSLEAMIYGLGQYHLKFHIDHMREVLQELKPQQAQSEPL